MDDCTHIPFLLYSLDGVTALRARLWQWLHIPKIAYIAYCIILISNMVIDIPQETFTILEVSFFPLHVSFKMYQWLISIIIKI